MAVNLPFEIYYKATNYNRRAVNQVVEDKNDVGISTLRRRSSRPLIYHAVTLVLSKVEYANLEHFVNATLLGGIVSFFFRDFLTGVTRKGRFKLESGAWYSTYEQDGNIVKVNVNIEECYE